MRELVRLRMRLSRDRKSFRYMRDSVDQSGKRRQISLGHADKHQAERQRHEEALESRVNVIAPMSITLIEFFRDGLERTEGAGSREYSPGNGESDERFHPMHR